MAKQSTTTNKRKSAAPRGGGRDKQAEEDNSQFGNLIRDREVESVCGALAVGFCVGLVLGAAVGRPSRPESWTDRVTAEGLGRKLMDSIERILPNAISERLYK